MKEQERVLFDNWSQFDQMAYLVHLRDEYNQYFEQSDQFWRHLIVTITWMKHKRLIRILNY